MKKLLIIILSLITISAISSTAGCSFGRTRESIERTPVESTSVSRGEARSESKNYQIFKGSDGRMIVVEMPEEK